MLPFQRQADSPVQHKRSQNALGTWWSALCNQRAHALANLNSNQLPNKRLVHVGWIATLLAFTAFIAFVFAGYRYWSWTGFGSVTHIQTDSTIITPAKTLWDWLELLIVPFVLAIGAFLFNRAEARVGRELHKNQIRETALETYLDRMTALMIENDLVNSNARSAIRSVARTRTLTILRRLDGLRKGVVIRFLYEAGLINGSGANLENKEGNENTITILAGADLSHVDLRGADLSGANLRGCNLKCANLCKAIFRETDLCDSDLSGAQLQEAEMFLTHMESCDLHGANLHKVHMERVRLNSANLAGADITHANIWVSHLENADLQNAQFQHSDISGTKFAVANLKGANLVGTGNIDRDELRSATIDDKTKLPDYLQTEFKRE